MDYYCLGWTVITIIIIGMGCTVSSPEGKKYLKTPTLCGELKVTVLNCHLERNTNSLMTMDPYVKLVMSNQIQKTDIRKKGGFDPRFDHEARFFVNSCYKPAGRSLEIFVMDQNLIASDKIIGYGLMDLDPIIKRESSVQDIKVRLNYECQEVGMTNLKLQFIEEPHQVLSFRFQTIDITKRTNIIGTMNCWVRLTVGQEVMETQKSKDTVESPPTWFEQVFMIEVPKCITNAVVEVFDQKKLIGKGEFPIVTYTNLKQQQIFKEIIRSQDGNGSAILEFSVIKGENAQFSTDKRVFRKTVAEANKEPPKKNQQQIHEASNKDKIVETHKKQPVAAQDVEKPVQQLKIAEIVKQE